MDFFPPYQDKVRRFRSCQDKPECANFVILGIHLVRNNEDIQADLLLSIQLSNIGAQNPLLLPAIYLLSGAEKTNGFADCFLADYRFYSFSKGEFTLICFGDYLITHDVTKKFMLDVWQRIEGLKVDYIRKKQEILEVEIRNLADEVLPLANKKHAAPIESRPSTKIVLVGLAQAGKTSIFKTFFERTSQEAIKEISPTVLREIHRPLVQSTEERITVFDLGGQAQYLPMHLKEEASIFGGSTELVFVIDVQNASRFEEAVQYFSQIVDIVINQEQIPSLTVLLNKFDPEQRNTLGTNLSKLMKTIEPIVQPLNPVYDLTSVYDSQTIERSLLRLFFRTLPLNVLERSLTADLFLEAYDNIFGAYRDSGEYDLSERASSRALKEISIEMGLELGKTLARQWYSMMFFGRPALDSQGSNSVLQIEHIHNIKYKMKCPISKEKRDPIYCWGTHGLIEGLNRHLGWGSVERIRTMAADNAAECCFEVRQAKPDILPAKNIPE